MQHILIFLLLGGLSPLAFADFNMRDASFLKTMKEFSHPLLERTYSSRSLWRGAVGFGWCSGFEKRIQIQSGAKALLIQCESEQEIQVQKKGHLWSYRGAQGEESFDTKGRLVHLEKPRTDLSYLPNGFLETIRTPKETLTFSYNPQRQIRQITSSTGQSSQYEYENDNLITVLLKKQKTRLRYDAFHNLTEIHSPQLSEIISYRLETDEILSYRNLQNQCATNFQFRKISATELQSKLERHCPGMKRQSQIFDFHFKKNKTGQLQISEMKVSGDLHDKTNLP